MKINFFNEDIKKPKIKVGIIREWIKNVVGYYGKSVKEINYIFCSDNHILEINNEYLKHNYFTDIITFDYSEKDKISGDIFISIETVTENAKEYDTEKTELYRVIIHGVLHLIGFKDKSPEEEKNMHKQEDFCLKMLFEGIFYKNNKY